jgi:hypothetical protein
MLYTSGTLDAIITHKEAGEKGEKIVYQSG